MANGTSFRGMFGSNAGPFQLRGRLKISPAQRFAGSIADRHSLRRQSFWRPLGMALRQSHSGTYTLIHRRDGDIYINSSVRLAFLFSELRRENHRNTGTRMLRAGLSFAEKKLTTCLPVRASRPPSPQADRLLRHLTARHERPDSVWTATANDSIPLRQPGKRLAPPAMESDLHPLVRTLRRNSPASLTEARTTFEKDTRGSVPAAPATAVKIGNQRLPERSLDVKELTNQVIRAIDQRIVAQRERLGRL